MDRARPLRATVPLDADHRSRCVQVHRSRHHRFATHDGLRVTRFEQVLVQLAASRPDLVQTVLHAGVNQDPRRLDRVLRHLDRLSGSRLPGLRGLLDLAVDLEGDPPTQSESGTLAAGHQIHDRRAGAGLEAGPGGRRTPLSPAGRPGIVDQLVRYGRRLDRRAA